MAERSEWPAFLEGAVPPLLSVLPRDFDQRTKVLGTCRLNRSRALEESRCRTRSKSKWTDKNVAALLTTFFPKMVLALPAGYVFSFFAGTMCLQLLWVKMMVPGTKNVPLEELQKELALR